MERRVAHLHRRRRATRRTQRIGELVHAARRKNDGSAAEVQNGYAHAAWCVSQHHATLQIAGATHQRLAGLDAGAVAEPDSGPAAHVGDYAAPITFVRWMALSKGAGCEAKYSF